MSKPLELFEIEQGVKIRAFYEEDPDWSWLELDDDKKQVESGELFQVVVEVSVYDASGEVQGSDILGGVCVKSGNVIEDVTNTVHDHGMIDNARADLKDKLARIISMNKGVSK